MKQIFSSLFLLITLLSVALSWISAIKIRIVLCNWLNLTSLGLCSPDPQCKPSCCFLYLTQQLSECRLPAFVTCSRELRRWRSQTRSWSRCSAGRDRRSLCKRVNVDVIYPTKHIQSIPKTHQPQKVFNNNSSTTSCCAMEVTVYKCGLH